MKVVWSTSLPATVFIQNELGISVVLMNMALPTAFMPDSEREAT